MVVLVVWVPLESQTTGPPIEALKYVFTPEELKWLDSYPDEARSTALKKPNGNFRWKAYLVWKNGHAE